MDRTYGNRRVYKNLLFIQIPKYYALMSRWQHNMSKLGNKTPTPARLGVCV